MLCFHWFHWCIQFISLISLIYDWFIDLLIYDWFIDLWLISSCPRGDGGYRTCDLALESLKDARGTTEQFHPWFHLWFPYWALALRAKTLGSKSEAMILRPGARRLKGPGPKGQHPGRKIRSNDFATRGPSTEITPSPPFCFDPKIVVFHNIDLFGKTIMKT